MKIVWMREKRKRAKETSSCTFLFTFDLGHARRMYFEILDDGVVQIQEIFGDDDDDVGRMCGTGAPKKKLEVAHAMSLPCCRSVSVVAAVP